MRIITTLSYLSCGHQLQPDPIIFILQFIFKIFPHYQLISAQYNNTIQNSLHDKRLTPLVFNNVKLRAIPQVIQNQLDVYKRLNEQSWNFVKNHNHLSLFQQTNQHTIALKGCITFNLNFQEVRKLFSHRGESFIQPHLKSKQLIIDLCESFQIYYSQSSFKIQDEIFTINDLYSRYEINRPDNHIIVKQSVDPSKFPQYQKQISKFNDLIINKSLDIIHIFQDKENSDKCLIQQIVVYHRDKNELIYSKFLKEVLINISIVEFEHQEIKDKLDALDLFTQEEIHQKNSSQQSQLYNNQKLQQQTTQPQVEEQNRIIASNSFPNNQVSPQNQKSSSSLNIYFSPNDRIKLVNNQIDSNHVDTRDADINNRIKSLNDNELKLLQEFRDEMIQYEVNDNTLIRYLQARNFKIKDAKPFFIQTLEFRRENDSNSYTMKDYPDFIEEDVHEIIGLDRWGHPILYTKCCNSHPEKLNTEKFSIENYIKFHRGFLEDGCAMMKEDVDCYMVIMDCYKLSMKNFSLAVMKAQFNEVFNYYPERQYKLFIINSDFLTRTIYRILKPFLPERTIQKIYFVGTNVDEIRQLLLTDIDLAVIPQRYGGGNPKVK